MLEKFLQKSPFVRILLPLMTGIILLEVLGPFPFLPMVILASGLLVLSVVSALRGAFLRNTRSGFLFSLFFLLTGMIVYQENTRIPVFPTAESYVAVMAGQPEKRAASYRAEALIVAAGNGDSLQEYHERVILYFSKEDSLGLPGTGDQIVFFRSPIAFMSDGNPYSFDYKSYMARRDIWRQVWLPAGQWILTGPEKNRGIRILAERFRERLLAIYAGSGLKGEELAILSALTLGYKKSLDPEVRQVFSESGAMHVLAVSGLHVGIIFLAFRLLFLYLKKYAWGRIAYAGGAIVVLWAYALLTGLSPSVQRAALMFSLVQAGDGLKRPSNIYNTLAASAFILLCINPVLLFEAGFQLSYSAVLGIVYFQPKFAGLFPVKNRLGKYFTDLVMVSLAAQLGTFAISSYYFHQFPVWFLGTNLVVIPAALIFILLAAGILLFSFFPPVSAFLAMVTGSLVSLVYRFLKTISQLPYSVFSGYHFDFVSLMVILLGFLLLVLFIESRSKRYFFGVMSLLVVFFLNNAWEGFKQANRREMVVYQGNVPNLHLVYGRENYLFLPGKEIESGEPFRPAANLVAALRLEPPVLLPIDGDYTDKRIMKTGSLLFFSGRHIYLPHAIRDQTDAEFADFIIDFSDIAGQQIPVNGWLITLHELKNNQEFARCHSVSNKGAFHAKF